MAVYYVNPFLASGSGTGTWANPYSITQDGGRTVAAGDELRLVGKYLTDILTATTYTATYGTGSITLAAGDADWAVGEIAYFPDYGTFAKVRSKSGAVIGWGHITPVPLNAPPLTVRRVNPTLAPPGAGTQLLFAGRTDRPTANNVTVSDGWVADGVRVTDSTVISLLHSSGTASQLYMLNNGGTGGEALPSDWTVDCSRTAYLGGTDTLSAYTVFVPSKTFTINFFQLTVINAVLRGGTASQPSLESGTFNFTHWVAPAIFGNGLFIKNLTMNISNYYVTNSAGLWQSPSNTNGDATAPFENANITIGNYTALATLSATSLLFSQSYILGRMSVTFNGDLRLNFAVGSRAISSEWGLYTVNFGPSFKIYSSGVQVTSLPYKFSLVGTVSWPAASLNQAVVPSIATPPGITFTGPHYTFTGNGATPRIFGNSSWLVFPLGSVPTQRFVSMPDASNYSLPVGQQVRAGNILFTFRDGSDPFEMLGMDASMRTDFLLPAGQTPIVTLDPTDVVTPGQPSLKSNLVTYSSGNQAYNYFRKAIKIPATAGVSRTVTGWVRSNVTTLDGDIRLRAVLNDLELAVVSMTGTASTAYRQFTMTFTPPYTGEVDFVWDQKFSVGGQSFWLADLTIT